MTDANIITARGTVGPEYARALLRFVDVARDLFDPKQHEERVDWIREQMQDVVRADNFAWLPDFIETPFEDIILDAGIEVGDALVSGRIRRGGKIGPQIVRSLLNYVDMAEDLFPPSQQAKAKEWVRRRLLVVADEHNARWLPDVVERPLEHVVINVGIDLTWEFLHSPRLRATLRTAAVG